MRVIVCGGRDYVDYERVCTVLNAMHNVRAFTVVIHGNMSGADQLADKWAKSRGICTAACDANWRYHGKSAGPIRNEGMLQLNPHLVVAFPGNKGTAHMIRVARATGVEVYEVYEDDVP